MSSSGYRELGLLAEGGMATVARAVRTSDGLPVVIKRVRPPLCFDASFLRLFADEAAVHGALDDDHVVRLLDRGDDAQGPFLVFEHVDGTDLGALLDAAIAAGRPLDVEFVLAVAVPLLSALAFVHEACRDGVCLDVVHRDVSPGNVLLGEDGAVKLADFGVAASRLKNEHTVAGEVKGKFAYMAPEQTRGDKATPQTDLFGVGVVLWECLANRRLWDGATDADVVRAVREDPAPALDGDDGGGRVGSDVAALVADLLHKDPAQRPSSARDVRERLRAACVERGLDDGLARVVARAVRLAPRRALAPLPEVRWRTQRVVGDVAAAPKSATNRRPFVVAAAVAVAVVGAVGALALAFPRTATTSEITTTLPPSASTTTLPPSTAPAEATTTTTPTTRTTPATPKRRLPARPAGAGTAAGAASTTTKREGFGRLSVTSEPWARVRVDGVVVAQETPLVGFTLAAGRHTVQLENPVVGLTKSVVVDVRADVHERVFVDLAR